MDLGVQDQILRHLVTFTMEAIGAETIGYATPSMAPHFGALTLLIFLSK